MWTCIGTGRQRRVAARSIVHFQGVPMSYSLRRHALATAVALAFSSSSMAATLFLEDFQTRIDPDTQQPVLRCTGPDGAGTYPFPSGWLLRNVDNRTPAAQVLSLIHI